MDLKVSRRLFKHCHIRRTKIWQNTSNVFLIVSVSFNHWKSYGSRSIPNIRITAQQWVRARRSGKDNPKDALKLQALLAQPPDSHWFPFCFTWLLWIPISVPTDRNFHVDSHLDRLSKLLWLCFSVSEPPPHVFWLPSPTSPGQTLWT
jgi:hypothetical protein